MEHITPLIQTLLWVGLIVFVLWRHERALIELVQAIQRRIASGGRFKLGPVEFDALESQTAEDQKQKLEAELNELPAAEETPSPNQALPGLDQLTSPNRDKLRARAFQAEDLALRALQERYGKPMQRQVWAAPGLQFDGALLAHGKMHVVEVKLARGPYRKQYFQDVAGRLLKRIRREDWKPFKLVFVIVYVPREIDTERERARLMDGFDHDPEEFELVCCRLPDLADQFGVALPLGE